MSESHEPTPHEQERRELAERLYGEARALPPGDRTRFIATACGGDDVLRGELEDLLAHSDAAESFFAALADNIAMQEPMPSPVAGRYEIIARIGAGGMGTVYRARDLRLQRDVALKFLPPYFAAALDAETHLLREARAAAALDHDNVCTVHEIASTDDGRPFISMAFYEGETLRERLQRGPIPVPEALEIARQIARGLAAAHALGIVHRDVKPGNVMLLRDGTVKLLDFGLARWSDATVSRVGATPGTVAYMSPEQARGDAVGPRSDLFSLGVVLYEMITGTHPFRGGNQAAVIQAILHNEPEPLRQRTPATPLRLQQVVTRLLQKDESARYAGADALLVDLALQPSSGAARFYNAVRARRWLVIASACVLVSAGMTAVWALRRGREPAAAAATQPSDVASDTASMAAKTIAVLPFRNLSRDPDEDYLVDGLTEELIDALSKVRALRVVARTSAFAFRGTQRDVREIGRALGVATILEGSVQKVGEQIRVRAQLINVADGLNMWSDTYDREVTDIFAVQRDLSLRIAAALEAGLSPAERDRVGTRPTTSAEAYSLYLKGRHFWNQRTPAAFVRAREYFERAIQADPKYAAAHAGLASVYSLQGLWGELAPDTARERMRAAALQAVTLDDGLAEAHAVRGAYLHVYEWDSAAAEREQLRAIELDPRYVTAHYFYGNLLRNTGRIEEALVQYRIALELDPLDPIVNDMLGRTLVLAGRFDEAREQFNDAIELDSMFWWPHAGLGLYYEMNGRLAESLQAYQRANALGGVLNVDIARVLARAGREREARQILHKLQQQATQSGLHDPDIATVWFALGDAGAAMTWLETAYRERHPRLRFIAGHPPFTALEVDPRYIDLLRRIGVRR